MNVAIIGASNNQQKFGNKAVRSYINGGHTVFPVNPNEAEVEGLKCYPAVASIPEKIDRVLLYVPPSVGLAVLDDLASAGVGEVLVNPGAGSPELMARGHQLGLNLVQSCAILAIGDSPHRY